MLGLGGVLTFNVLAVLFMGDLENFLEMHQLVYEGDQGCLHTTLSKLIRYHNILIHKPQC